MAILGKQRPREFETIYAGIVEQLAKNENNEDKRAENAWLTICKGLLEGLVQATEAGLPFVYTNLGNTPELVLALGDTENEVVPLGFEALGGMQAWWGDTDINMEVIDLVESSGLASDVCSADRLALGYMMKNLMPPPVGGCFVNTPCDSQLVAAEGFKEIMGVDPFLVDIPYHTGEKEIQYVADQLWEQIAYLEKVTGKRLNWDRLKGLCEENNRMVEHILEWTEWRKRTPCPQSSKMVGFGFVLMNTLAGTPAGTWYASELAADAKARVLAGKQAAAGEEKVRTIWYHDPNWKDLEFYDWMDQQLGMTVPMDLFGYITAEAFVDTTSQNTMLYGLARKLSDIMPMSRQFRGAADTYIDSLIQVVSEFDADCAVFAGHLGCKHAWGLIGLLKEKLRREDIPLLVFEYDMFDPRITSSDKLKKEFNRFMEDIMLPRRQLKMKG